MATQINAATPTLRPAPRLIGLAITILAAAAVLAVFIGMQGVDAGGRSAADSVSQAVLYSRSSASGYPLHAGLAGPSRVSVAPTADDQVQHGAGYPLHGGLAGPSRAGSGN